MRGMEVGGKKSSRLLGPLYRFLARKLPSPSGHEEATLDYYGGAMTDKFNWLHRRLFPRFFRRIRVDGHPPEDLKKLARDGTLIYITPFIGQLEYNYFNYLALEHELPLARFVNGLETTWWRPLNNILKIWQTRCEFLGGQDGELPHPVRSGHLANLLTGHQTALIRLRTSRVYDDLFWDDPAEDPLLPLIGIARSTAHKLYIVPMQFLWDRRPDRLQKGLVDLIFGERDHPGKIRKLVWFWRHYKKRAVAQIGTPLPLKEFLDGQNAQTDFMYARALRQHLLGLIQRERLGTTGPAIKPRHWILDQVTDSERVQRAIYTSSKETGRPLDDLKQVARKYANEIAADTHYGYIDLAAWVLRWVFKNVYNGFSVNEEGLAQLRRAMSQGTVVLAPNHRSHVDYLLLSYILYIHNLAMPHVAAGINMAFWPAGPFFRKCGAFFLRRTFGKNPVYKAVFEEYLQLLVRERYCIEFFIEGGRSRTGKSLKPKMGILSILTQALREGAADNINFVPVTITYDQVIEHGAYMVELAGGTKPRERGWHLLKLGRYTKRRHGHIYVNFGDPIPFSDAHHAVVPAAPAPRDLTDAQKKEVVRHLSQTIMFAISKEAVVTPAALAATALLLPLKRAVTEAEISDTVDYLCKYLTWKGAKFSDLVMSDRQRAISEALERFSSVAARLVSRHEEFDPICYAVDESRRMQLDYSKNTIVHFFASLGSLAVILRTHFLRGEHEITLSEIDGDYNRCKQLFHHEFAFSTRFKTLDHIKRIVDFLGSAGLVEMSAGEAPCVRVTPPGAARLRLYAGMLRNFFESYKVALQTGARIPVQGIDEKGLIRLMIRYGQHLLLLGQIRCAEAISQANFKNAIDCFTELGLLIPKQEGPKGKTMLTWINDHPERERLQLELEEWC